MPCYYISFLSNIKERFTMKKKNCLCVILFSLILLLSSCATKTKIEYRDRDVNHYITNTVHDTLIDRSTDSVYVYTRIKGDTVFVEKYNTKIRWRDRVVERRDTCWRDSIAIQYKEKIKEVVKIPKIYKFAFAFSIIVLIFAIVKVLIWLRTR